VAVWYGGAPNRAGMDQCGSTGAARVAAKRSEKTQNERLQVTINKHLKWYFFVNFEPFCGYQIPEFC
jgi:hypothetical protein